MQQVADVADDGRRPAGQHRISRRSASRVRAQQPGKRDPQQCRRRELVAVLGRLVRAAQERRSRRVVQHRLRESGRAGRPAELGGDVRDDADLRIQHPVAPAGGCRGVAGVHHIGIQQRDGASAGAQQAAAVLELLDPGLDEPEGVGLVRVPAVAVRQVPGAQQVDAVDRRVPPVPSNLRLP